MAARIHQLQQTLELRNCLHLWKMENMNLWRMTTLDQPEKWFTPSGEELHNCAEVADYLLSLPPGGSRAKLRNTAPSPNWEGLELEFQQPEDDTSVWNRGKIVKRLTDTTCKVRLLGENKLIDLNLFEVRCRWLNPKQLKISNVGNKAIQQLTAEESHLVKMKKEQQSKRKALAANVIYRPNSRLKECVLDLRRERLREVCSRGSAILAGNDSINASAIAMLLETVNAELCELELTVDPTMILLSREKISEEVVEAFAAYSDGCEKKGWIVYFKGVFEGKHAGESVEVFGRGSKEYCEGLIALGRHLNAKQYPVLNLDANWTFYRCLDLIEECNDMLNEIEAQSGVQ